MTTRIGILGFGLRASLASYAHQPDAGSRVVAVADPDPARRRAAADALGGDVTLLPDLDALLDQDLDALMVLTPDHLHEEHALRALERGVPTFLEKPLAVSTEGADRILDQAWRTGTRLYVGHNMRHMPVVRALRSAVQDGRIGEVKAVWCRHFVSTGGDFYFKDWHADRSKTLGLLLQKGAHDIDVIHWLAGGYTTRAQAMGTLAVYGDITDRRDNSDRQMRDWYSTDSWPPASQRELAPVLDVEDLSMANFALDNGVLASYQQCHFTPDYWRSYTVIGTEGRLENFGDGGDATVALWDRRSDTYRAEPDATLPVGAADGGHGGADPLLVAEFLRFAREGGPTDTSPVAARQAVAAGVAATSSLRSGGAVVEVPPLPAELEAYFAASQTRPDAGA
ncbi:Predicted dehydrogenase [Friedmanniella luteola]|uniref:Predicted dehydrogenase n=1 Tax=Friedmanniella luteola TaxID=546871 RepID=A0A1H1R453_9ACTN|nr:Gfo/Idh/MocA family oxidoreductase [Friedmanniella luteola]SDS30430.1 Predicted dehydrogenase [Friedmanniella luteola]